jgi:diguanylate cyclase (GGDEF)-like protein
VLSGTSATPGRLRVGRAADLPMAGKLLLLVGVCCAMTALVLGVGAVGLASVSRRADDISRHNVRSAALLASINSAALRVQADVGSVGVSPAPVARQVFRDRIRATEVEMDHQIAEYRATIATVQQRQALLRFTVWWQSYRNYRDHRLLVLADTDPVAFQTSYLGQAQLISDRAMKALDELLRYEQANGQRAAQAARSTYRTALAVMVSTMVIGLAIALLLARWISGLIVRPVRLVADVLSSVAAGDLTREAEVAQRDEVGQMALALTTATRSMRSTVQELRRQEDLLRHAALYDQLTGLPNRTYFLERLERAIGESTRDPGYHFAMLLLDLDGFKIVNDSLGHLAGDELLVRVAERITVDLRPVDVAARFGGDEFAVLLDGVEDLATPAAVAERLHTLLAAPFQLAEQEVVVSASIGIAPGGADYASAEDLIRDADIAMYSAKSREKGTNAVFDAVMRTRAVERMRTEAELRQALERGELEVYYQPIMDLGTGRLAAFETLIRWRHPGRGLTSPREFLPIAEESGLVLPIGRWLLDETCQQLRRWRDEYRADHVRVTVNVSNREFWRGTLLDDLTGSLAEAGLTPGCLAIEVTEGVIMHDVGLARKILNELHDLGVGLHIDDFGTGYSSLEALHNLRIDALKIDRSFVAPLGVDRKSDELARTIVVMGTNLGLDLIAEGIETTAQLDHVRRLGCGYGQGYWFSRPVPATEAAAFFTDN